ncbi:MAG TPA: sigma-70 region 4 domain-containing protein [Terracidiphilus sp.]|nr:sigma-70 region 4 domain-containing protein [Terracidiphilus sp.]
MSAAPQLPLLWASSSPDFVQQENEPEWQESIAADFASQPGEVNASQAPQVCLAFYRKHTANTLRRYLYASMQVGRTPSILGDPVGRGWVSSRIVRTFEDALIFVLDVERCLEKLEPLERVILSRMVLQDYTQAEVAGMLGMATRTAGYKFGQALDRLTEKLLESDLLLIPE